MRIVSTVPSQTELLSHLGLDDALVGITKFCIHPEHIYRSVSRIGGTKDLKLDAIRALKPDLVLANKEENDKGQIEALAEDFPVHVTEVTGLDSALRMISEVGARVGKSPEAAQLVQEIQAGFTALQAQKQREVLYLIWQNPYMSVGSDTYIHDMLERCGLQNLTGDQSRYPEVAAGEYAPEYILLSSEPFPFKEKHIADIQAAWPNAQIRLVDGECFSWYGPRMIGAASYFKEFIASLG